MTYKKDQFDTLLERFTEVQARNTEVLNEYVDTTNELITLLLTGGI